MGAYRAFYKASINVNVFKRVVSRRRSALHKKGMHKYVYIYRERESECPP